MPHPCPHCHVASDVDPHAALGFSCRVCGGPRLALDLPDASLSAATTQLLEGAGRAQTQHIMYTAGGSLLSAMGVLALAIVTGVVVVADPGAIASLAAYVAAAVPTLAGLLGLIAAARARSARSQSLRRARVQALADLQAQLGELDAARASQALRLAPDETELLLAEASVASLLGNAPGPRLRVAAASATLPAGTDELAEATAPPGSSRSARGDTEI